MYFFFSILVTCTTGRQVGYTKGQLSRVNEGGVVVVVLSWLRGVSLVNEVDGVILIGLGEVNCTDEAVKLLCSLA